MNERRRERLAAFIREALPTFFSEEVIREPGVFISIQHVEIPESGGKANVFVSVFPDTVEEGIAKALKMSENKATHFVRVRLKSKYSPTIRFQVVEVAR